jgi:hypothetical protein
VVSIDGTRWKINGKLTNPGSAAEGLLMNVRMVNSTFEDRGRTDFDPEANTNRFIASISDYAAHGVNAFTLCLQGGNPGYEGAVNTAFELDGSLRPDYLQRVERVIRACNERGVVVILGLYYQRQSKYLRDEAAVRAGVVNAANWIRERGFSNVVVEIANEYPHSGFVHPVIRDPKGQASLIRLAKQTAPGLLVSASGYGDGAISWDVAEASDFLLMHLNTTTVADIPARVNALKSWGKPIVCNEDDRVGQLAVDAKTACVSNGCAYGLMLKAHNQIYPFHFDGAADDMVYYSALKKSTILATQAELVDNSQISIFPTLVTDGLLNIKMNKINNVSITIVNLNGQTEFTNSFSGSSPSTIYINTNSLKSGLYFVKIQYDNKTYIQKFIIQ